MKGEFWKSTRDQRIWLASLLLLLTAIVFWPTLRHFAGVPFRPRLARVGQLQVAIPITWQLQKKGAAIVVWKPHMTILSPRVRSSVELEIAPSDLTNPPDLTNERELWQNAVTVVLQRLGFKDIPTRRTLNGLIGPITCLDATDRTGRVVGSCLEPVHGLVASFEGRTSDMESFQSIITSVHPVPE